MPVHNVGYRKWEGAKTPVWSRWWIITESGIRIALKTAWVRRILLICWLPVLYWGLALFLIEQSIDQNVDKQVGLNLERLSEAAREEATPILLIQYAEQIRMIPDLDVLVKRVEYGDATSIRHTLWSWLLMTFFRYPQGLAILFLIGFIVPSLISQDVRSRAFLVYFSRPIGRLEYIVGKTLIPVIFVAMITTIPGICLYFFGVTLSPNLSVISNTWDIPLRILATSIVVIAPTCAMALMFSALTQESRFATFAWFAVWALGHAAWFAILITQAIRMNAEPFSQEVINHPLVQQWSIVSLYNNLSHVQNWIFGFRSFSEIYVSLVVLVVLTLVSLWVLYRGVSAPIKI